MISADEFKEMMSGLAASVTVVTCEGPSGPVGITVSAFTSVSVTPPVVLVCIDKSAASLDAFLEAPGYTVNFLPEGTGDLAMVFATRGADKFASVDVSPPEHPHGGPVLDPAFGHFVCSTTQRVDVGDHWILIGEARAGGRSDHRLAPLVYLSRSFVRTAPL